jgi:hypothetical protein
MTEDIKVTAEQIRGIEGMENYEESGAAVPYIKILNGSAALEIDLPAGTMINIATKEVLAEKGEDFKFIPIYYFKRWTIWNNKTRTLEKFTFDKKGQWSDGTAIQFEDVNWVGKTPPRAQESLEFVVLPVADLKKPAEDQAFAILPFAFTNKGRVQTAKRLEQLIYQTSVNEKVNKMYACAYSINSVKKDDGKGNMWFDYNDPKFLQKVKEDTLLAASEIYKEVKDINKMTAMAIVEPQLHEAPAAVVENTEF